MNLSLRWRILALIAVINLITFGVGFVVLVGELERDRARISDQLNTVIASLVVPMIDSEGGITVTPILRSTAWRSFEDVTLVRARFDVDARGELHPRGAYLNPLGRYRRTGAFDEQAVLKAIQRAIETRTSVPSSSGFAIPIVDQRGGVWGGCWFKPPGGQGIVAAFGRLLPWFLVSTLLLTLGTFVTLRRLVLDPVNRLAEGAQRMERGDLGARIAPTDRRDELSRLITSFNAMAEKVEGYNKELARDVEIATEKVRRAEAAAMTQRRLAATGELAAGIAHEINNPLAGLLNAVETLQKGTLPPEKRDQYHALLRSGLERIQNTVGKLLRFTPRNSKPVPLALVDPVVDAIALVAYRAQKLKVVIRLARGSPEDDAVIQKLRALPPVLGQANELGQAALNVLVNALDALEENGRGGRVDIDIVSHEHDVVLSIEDDGGGVDPAELARVADLFYTTKDVGKGTGLGLSIVHGVVANHGGSVQLASEKGRFFRVEIRLPAWSPTADQSGRA
ncbi:MAG: HAMP domain-containing sensor histidine kinase [Planctomycetota bacterium]|nr:HAMP domain-containing sensor histidine kinase [Planctomycetota bacterium]